MENNDNNYTAEKEQNTTPQPMAPRNTDKSHKNAALLWGVLLIIAGLICIGYALLGQIQQNPDMYLLYIGISVAPVGFVLLGIGAIVDRLNTIINMIKENKNDKS